jgi:hypothetical protein
VSRLVQSGCQTRPPPEVLAAYEAPFPDPAYAAAVRAMPELVPTSPHDPLQVHGHLARVVAVRGLKRGVQEEPEAAAPELAQISSDHYRFS